MHSSSSTVVLLVCLAIGLVLVSISLLTLLLPMTRIDPDCPKCGYCLVGLHDSSDSCPECGFLIHPHHRRARVVWSTRWWSLPPVLAMVSGLFFIAIAVMSAGVIHASLERQIELVTTVRGSGVDTKVLIKADWKDETLSIQGPVSAIFYGHRSIKSLPKIQTVSMQSKSPARASGILPADWPVSPAKHDPKVLEGHVRALLAGKDDVVVRQVLADVQTIYSGKPVNAFAAVLPAPYIVSHDVFLPGNGAPNCVNLGMFFFAAIFPIGLAVWGFALAKKRKAASELGDMPEPPDQPEGPQSATLAH